VKKKKRKKRPPSGGKNNYALKLKEKRKVRPPPKEGRRWRRDLKKSRTEKERNRLIADPLKKDRVQRKRRKGGLADAKRDVREDPTSRRGRKKKTLAAKAGAQVWFIKGREGGKKTSGLIQKARGRGRG